MFTTRLRQIGPIWIASSEQDVQDHAAGVHCTGPNEKWSMWECKEGVREEKIDTKLKLKLKSVQLSYTYIDRCKL